MIAATKTRKKDVDIAKKELEKKAADLSIAYLERSPKNIDQKVINIIPKEVAGKHKIVAFEKSEKTIKVATADPRSADAMNVLRFIAEKENVEIEVYLVSESTIKEMLDFYVGPSAMVREAVES